MFEFSDEFLDLLKRMEERGETEEDEEPVVIQPDDVNPERLGQEQEQEAVTVEPLEVSFFEFFFKINGFISYVAFFLFPLEQFFPSESIGEWCWPLFLDGDK